MNGGDRDGGASPCSPPAPLPALQRSSGREDGVRGPQPGAAGGRAPAGAGTWRGRTPPATLPQLRAGTALLPAPPSPGHRSGPATAEDEEPRGTSRPWGWGPKRWPLGGSFTAGVWPRSALRSSGCWAPPASPLPPPPAGKATSLANNQETRRGGKRLNQARRKQEKSKPQEKCRVL